MSSVKKESVVPTTTVSLPATPVKIKKRSILVKNESEKENSALNEQQSEQPLLTLEPSPEQEPAYKRFAHLVRDIPAPEPVSVPTEKVESAESKQETKSPSGNAASKFVPWLPLHERFGIYERIVFNIDSLCMLSAGRSLPCVFHKIQKTLEGVVGRNVPIDYLERIKTVWPEGYEYSPLKVISQGKRVDSVSIAVPGLADTDSSAALLNDRRETIKAHVQKFVIKAHNQFVSEKFNRPVPADAVLKQWHPEFNQETIEDIPRTGLLTGDVIVEPKVIGVPKHIASILSTPTKSAAPSVPETPTVDTKSDVDVAKSTESGAKLSLLERIRAKEQKLLANRMFGSDLEQAHELALLSQLEKFCQSVMFSFTADKKTTMFLTDLTNRLIISSSVPISAAEVLERLKLLQKIMPNWIRVKDDVQAPRTVKLLDKNFSLSQVIDCLTAYQNSLTKSSN